MMIEIAIVPFESRVPIFALVLLPIYYRRARAI
jgi:hypothetical protein